jgi:DNA-binding NarL/FixJ family response regulator
MESPHPTPNKSLKTDFLTGIDETSRIHVVIVDDVENERHMIRQAVEKSGEFVCVGAYGSAKEALAEIPKVRPHVVLMDIRMPGMDGHECTRRLKVIMVQLKIIIVTELMDVETMNKSLEAGADGYLTKPVGGAQFLAMLKLTVRDGMPFKAISCKTRVHSGGEAESPKAGSLLTMRENQVMALLSKGLLSKEIPDQLGISFSAVHKHQLNSYRKLGAHNRIEALNNWRENNHP